jgi:hypothetical protein
MPDGTGRIRGVCQPRRTLEMGSTLAMPENLRFDLLTVQKMRGVNRVSHAVITGTLSCAATASIRPARGKPTPFRRE